MSEDSTVTKMSDVLKIESNEPLVQVRVVPDKPDKPDVTHATTAPGTDPASVEDMRRVARNYLTISPATQPTNSTTVNAKTVSVINAPAAPAAIPAPPKNADHTTIAKD